MFFVNGLKVSSLGLAYFSLRSFPSFCALLIGSYSILQWVLSGTFKCLIAGPARASLGIASLSFVRFVSAFCASWMSMNLLKKDANAQSAASIDSDGEFSLGDKSQSQGMELTVATTVRALDTVVACVLGAASSASRLTVGETRKAAGVRRVVDISLFASSAAVTTDLSMLPPSLKYTYVFSFDAQAVMWYWVYSAGSLPPTYNKFIAQAAQIDGRLIEALRLCTSGRSLSCLRLFEDRISLTLRHAVRTGKLLYGTRLERDGLKSMCIDMGWPLEWAEATPIP